MFVFQLFKTKIALFLLLNSFYKLTLLYQIVKIRYVLKTSVDFCLCLEIQTRIRTGYKRDYI